MVFSLRRTLWCMLLNKGHIPLRPFSANQAISFLENGMQGFGTALLTWKLHTQCPSKNVTGFFPTWVLRKWLQHIRWLKLICRLHVCFAVVIISAGAFSSVGYLCRYTIMTEVFFYIWLSWECLSFHLTFAHKENTSLLLLGGSIFPTALRWSMTLTLQSLQSQTTPCQPISACQQRTLTRSRIWSSVERDSNWAYMHNFCSNATGWVVQEHSPKYINPHGHLIYRECWLTVSALCLQLQYDSGGKAINLTWHFRNDTNNALFCFSSSMLGPPLVFLRLSHTCTWQTLSMSQAGGIVA